MWLIDALKYLMNGAKLPNWLKLIIVLGLLWAFWLLQRGAVDDVTATQRQTTATQIRAMRALVFELHAQIEDTAEADSLRSAKIERNLSKLTRKVDRIDTEGTQGGNERMGEIEAAIRALRKR